MQVKKEQFGTLAGETPVYAYTLENQNGMRAVILDYGANLQQLWVPDGKGVVRDVVLGFQDLEAYCVNSPGFGATVGPVANRIAKGTFTLNGKTYLLEKNDGENNLHSGFASCQRKLFHVEKIHEGNNPAIVLTCSLQDGELGMPGNRYIQVTYTLLEENALEIHYEGTSDQDTLFNMTNHSYFNLKGQDQGDTLDHLVWIGADSFTETDEASIPTGAIVSVSGTPMDFTSPKTLGEDIDADFVQLNQAGGYDHNYVLPEQGTFRKVAWVMSSESGIRMDVFTDLPGLQLYSGNYLTQVSQGKKGAPYGRRYGVCFETQYYPDAIHHPAFPQPVTKRGETYRTTTRFSFLAETR